MRLRLSTALLCIMPVALALAAPAAAQPALDSFAVLAGQSITNTGPTTIGGNVGLSPGTANDLLPAQVTGTIYVANAIAIQAQIDLVNAYNNLLSRPTTFDLTGVDLGGQVLRPGVYSFNTSAQLTGTLTLDAQGNPNAVFIFKIGSTLTTASASSVVLVNGAQGGNVFFVVGSSATLGSTTSFTGRILALTSISLITSATVNCGAVLARNGSVTLQSNVITTVCPVIATTVGTVIGSSATNTAAAAGAIDAFVAGGGTLPPGFADLLAFLTPAELAAALAELSGEAATGVAPTGMQAMNSFMSQIFNSAFDDNLPDRPGTVTVKALGYGPEDEAQAKAGSAFASFDGASPSTRPWDVWASAYGGQYNVDGDGSQGTHDRFSTAFGFAAGLGVRIAPETKVGFAIGAGGTSYDLADGLGGGQSDTFNAALYSRRDFSAAYVTGVIAYGWNGITTDRTLSLAGTDRLTASFDAQNVAGRLEAGYRMGWFTPYAGLGLQAFYSPAYSETSTLGSPFALHYDAQTSTNVRTELGLRIARSIALGDGAKLRLHSSVGWAHDNWSDLGLTAQFQALPGSTFAVQGAVPPSDLLLVSAGAEVGLANGFSVASLFDGEFADGTQKYEGRVKLRYAW